MELRETFKRFESLGNNCEFGIVQAETGHDVSSLFRTCGFNETGQIIDAVAARFDGMFEEGNFHLKTQEGWHDHALECHRFGIDFHTGLPSDREPSAEMLKARLVAFRTMKRQCLAELRRGDKVFVYRHKTEFSDALANRLLDSIRAHGPGSLLFVREDARPESRFGWAEATDRPGLLYGGVPCLSDENPPQINFAAWARVAQRALALLDSEEPPREPPGPARPPPPPEGHAGVVEHRFFDRTPFFSFIVRARPGATLTAEALLWIAPNFTGGPIKLAMLGFPSEGFADPDPGKRGAWQRIFVTARVPKEHTQAMPALLTSPGTRGVVYTAGWRVWPVD